MKAKKSPTELSNFAWENKHASIVTSLEWKVPDKARSYKPGSKK